MPTKEITNLKERNSCGILTSMLKSEARDRFSDEVSKIDANRLRHNVNSSEDHDTFSARVLRIFEDMIKNQQDDIEIVTHCGVISTLVREFLRLGDSELGDCSILKLEVNGGKAKLQAQCGATAEHFDAPYNQ